MFKSKSNYVQIGRCILRLQEIKEIIMIAAFGDTKENAKAPFKLTIYMKYADNLTIDFISWDERAECFELLWKRLKNE